jgi:site-specific recombinase XerD
MLLSDAVVDFMAYCEVEKGLTPKSRKTFGFWLRAYVTWLMSSGYDAPALEDFSTATVRKYLYHLSGQHKRPRTIRCGMTVIRSFGTWLCDEIRAIPENPALSVSLPKLDAATRHLTTDDQVSALLSACERQSDPYRVALSRAILSVFVYCGLRRQECLDLQTADVNFVERCVVVQQGKGQKRRVVYPHPDCLRALRDYLAVRPRDSQLTWLFLLDRSRRIHHAGLKVMLDQVRAIAGLKDESWLTPHSIRHNTATRLLRAGADIRAVQAFLGHANLATTAVYLSCDEQRLREIANLTAIKPQSPKAHSVSVPTDAAPEPRLRRAVRPRNPAAPKR